ncbi:rhodanese-like domain-containing protein [Iamia sp. SCSIO 61187]|nr:rhodanese-like domain-containing protein [Iamia sp. SCSIO 61187]
MPEVDIEAFAGLHGSGVTVIDVREPHEYEEGHVPGAMLIPLGEVPDRVAEVPDDRTVYLVCAVGGRSMRAAEHLAAQGRDVVNVAGGTKGWIAAGLPTVAGDQPG